MIDWTPYKKRFNNILNALFTETSVFKTTQRCCLMIAKDDIHFLHINKKKTEIEVLACEYIKYDKEENLAFILSSLVKTYKLINIPIYWLLQFDAYQIFLIESLPVPEDEFVDALNWRVRGLINFPIQDATVDYFQIPPKKSAPDSPLIATLACKTVEIKKVIDTLKVAGMNLTNISVPEMALKNLTALYEHDDKSTALIYFIGNFALLNISRNSTLYFTRRMAITPPIDPTGNPYEQFSLDIMRYFDYFQSQWRFPSPSRVFVHAHKDKVQQIISYISEYLTVPIERFTLKPLTIKTKHLEALENEFLLPFGCIIEEDEVNEAKS